MITSKKLIESTRVKYDLLETRASDRPKNETDILGLLYFGFPLKPSITYSIKNKK